MHLCGVRLCHQDKTVFAGLLLIGFHVSLSLSSNALCSAHDLPIGLCEFIVHNYVFLEYTVNL